MDGENTEGQEAGATAEQPEQVPVKQIEQEAVAAAEQTAEAGVKAVATDIVSGNMGDAAEDAADAMEHEVEQVVQPIAHAGWAAFKAWVRTEIEHMQAGHSRESREKLNP